MNWLKPKTAVPPKLTPPTLVTNGDGLMKLCEEAKHGGPRPRTISVGKTNGEWVVEFWKGN